MNGFDADELHRAIAIAMSRAADVVRQAAKDMSSIQITAPVICWCGAGHFAPTRVCLVHGTEIHESQTGREEEIEREVVVVGMRYHEDGREEAIARVWEHGTGRTEFQNMQRMVLDLTSIDSAPPRVEESSIGHEKEIAQAIEEEWDAAFQRVRRVVLDSSAIDSTARRVEDDPTRLLTDDSQGDA